MRYLNLFVFIAIFVIAAYSDGRHTYGFEDLSQLPMLKPNDILLTNKSVAISMAMVVLEPIYKEEILDQKPFTAILVNDSLWHIYGRKRNLSNETDVIVETGGTIHIYIHKSNCKVISVYKNK